MTTSNSIRILAWILLFNLGLPSGFAETIHLREGGALQGVVEHSYNGIYTIITPDGPKVLGRHEISGIEFPQEVAKGKPQQLPKNPSDNFLYTLEDTDAPFGSPLNTFRTWRKAAIEGNRKGMIKCYASFKQGAVKKKLKALSKDAWEEMRAATANTEFLPQSPIYQGDRAFMEVAWTLNMQGETQILKFILEKDDWKLMQ